MILTVNQSEPDSPYFLVAMPKRSYDEPRGYDGSTIVELRDKGQVTKAAFYGYFEVSMFEFEMFDSYARIAYGVSAKTVKSQLLKKYPELNNPGAKVEYWILKRIKEN